MATHRSMHEHLHATATKDIYGSHSVLSVPAGSSDTSTSLPGNLVVARDWNAVDRLTDPAKNILIRSWTPSPLLRQTIAATRFAALPRLALTLPKDKIAYAASSAPDDLSRQLLSELAPALSALASIAPGDKLRLSLCKTREQSCPLFHTDRVPVRLICTLRGPGTEWLDNAQVNRKALGRSENRKIAGPDATVYAACQHRWYKSPKHRNGKSSEHRSQCPFTAHDHGGGTDAAKGGLYGDSCVSPTRALCL